MPKKKFSKIREIIKTARNGGMYILVDDENRENEGDLVFCASDVTPKKINFMAKYGRGLICLAINSSQAKKLNLNYMSPVNKSRHQTAFTVSIEAKSGITTGISAQDRSRTIKIATRANVKKKEIVSPGHIFPIIAKDGGVLVRAGHTEGSVDISKLANKNPSGVICEIMNDNGKMAKGKELIEFANIHKLKIGRIDDLIAYRLKVEKLVKLKKTDSIKIQKQKYKKNINQLIKIFHKNKIQVRPVWFLNHLQKPYRSYQRYNIDNAKKLINNILCLPSSTSLKSSQIEKIVSILRKYQR